MELTFERDREIERETASLPAGTYNRLTVLFARGAREPLFVPIRSMQYLAIVDHEEIVFVDGAGPRVIEVAWQNFHRQERVNLQAPVTYDRVYYTATGRQISRRLQGEFFKALLELEKKHAAANPVNGSVTPLKR